MKKKNSSSHRIFLGPLQEFFSHQASSGILLLLATLIALFWANSPWREAYFHLWEIPINLTLGSFQLEEPLHVWINDGLMAVFFFVVGLEIKREMLVGEISTPRKALLPLVAAFGGMVVPALFYLAFNPEPPTQNGWGIPMATDIAFALGVLSLLGNRIPLAIKVFLTALAIADDIGAVLVIAFFYSNKIVWLNLLLGGLFLTILILGNRRGVRNPIFYAVFGIGGLWTAFFFSGVNPTVAGVLAAFAIPARTRINSDEFLELGKSHLNSFAEASRPGSDVLSNKEQLDALYQLTETCELAETPLQRLEDGLHPWVTFFIMPLFAFANAGVTLKGDLTVIHHPVSLGILTGLLLGKPIGIFLFTFAAVKLRWVAPLSSVNWRHIFGAGLLGGIGFTMSLFITNLAFGSDPTLMATAKYGILGASLLAGLLGWFCLKVASPKKES